MVAEALTNVAKHSGATRREVGGVQDGDRLGVTVDRQRPGGAHLAKGHGLAGLEHGCGPPTARSDQPARRADHRPGRPDPACD